MSNCTQNKNCGCGCGGTEKSNFSDFPNVAYRGDQTLSKTVTVTDLEGNLLPNAHVVNSSNGDATITDGNGKATITATSVDDIISISHVGGDVEQFSFGNLPENISIVPNSLDEVIITSSDKSQAWLGYLPLAIAGLLVIPSFFGKKPVKVKL